MRYRSSLRNRIKLLRKRPLHRLKIGWRYLFCRRSKEPVFIVTTRRSGSNLLLSYFDSVPGISFGSEILNASMFYGLRSAGISKAAVFRHIAHSINDYPHRICGVKLLKVQLENHGVSLEELKIRFPNARFIILQRKNRLEQFISLKRAERTDVWLLRKAQKAPVTPPVYIDPGELDAYRREISDFYRNLHAKEWLRSCSLFLSYEELAAHPQKVFEEAVFPFLGVAPVAVSSSLKKQNTRPLRETVINFEEIQYLG